MIFRRPLVRYGTTPEPETAFQKAGQLWDERIGTARQQAHNWRLIAFGSVLVSVLLATGLIVLSAQSQVVPFVVEVDRRGGVVRVAPAVQHYHPNAAQISYFLARFIREVRSLSSDPVVVRRNWLNAYAAVTSRGAAQLSIYARRHNPFAHIGVNTVSVEVKDVVRISRASFQVRWVEDHYAHDSLIARTHWTAVLSIVLRPPRTLDVLRQNPLGLYVDDLHWSRDLEPQSGSARSKP
jgi:type IV secretion system protein VirB5